MGELKAAVLPDRGVLRIGGPEARPFLQNLVTNNVDLADGRQAVYAGLLTPQGKFLFDFIVAADGDGLLLDCDRARAADLVKRLNFYKLRAQVTIEDVSATRKVAAIWGGDVKAAGAFADPRLAALGHRLIAENSEAALKAAGAAPATPADYHRHRIALGVGDAAHDFEPDRTFPLEVNFDEMNGVDFQKGCFIGQEVTSRTKRRGSVRKRLLPCIVEGDLPKPHTPVRAAAREVGTVFSGDAESGRVMALLRLDLIHGATLEAGNSGLTPEKPVWATFEIDGAADGDEDA
ncbi:MAG: folate-binding protein [Parvibaculum sp.]|uniref:CAF17-like 4Fe-4S cluster assembly/insertion protein YgfZ n=1 Tax=Parvibaculum sp. TaxID=2024848 RepID=UPI0028412769|nr:folate-binding protein [Parvibaculum sp.]MDR3497912.1 folate-binding protein [Parvibaculum sp.]